MNDQADNILTWDIQDFLDMLDPDNRLMQYYKLLEKENSRINLVSRETLSSAKAHDRAPVLYDRLVKLAAESLVPVYTLNKKSFHQYLDIGSGGGFPAIPILLTHDIVHTTLVERTQKKAAALRRILIGMELHAEIYEKTFEDVKFASTLFDLITIRLVKLTDTLLRRATALLAPRGVLIYYAKPSFTPNLPDIQYQTIHYFFHGNQVRCATLFYKNHS